MKRRGLLILAALLFPALAFSQLKVVTPEECVRLSVSSSEEVRISESKLAESKARVSEAGSQMYPQLKLSGAYTRLSSVDPFSVTVPFSPSPVKIADSYLNYYLLRLGATQNLFTGFRLEASKNVAEIGTMISSADYDESVNNISFEALTAYWNLYKAFMSNQIAGQSVSQTERRIADTKNFIRAGLATSTDLLRLEVQNANAVLQLMESENSINIARTALNRLMGYPFDFRTEPDTTAPPAADLLREVEYYVEHSLKDRNEIRKLEYARQSAEQNVRVAKSSYYPYVTLFGNLYYSNPNQRIQPPENEFNASWDVGLGFTWDIWNWGLTSSQTEQAELVLFQSKESIQLARRKIEQEVRQKYGTADYQKKRIDAAALAVDLAEKSYGEVVRKYDVQLATSTEVADAETSLFIARRNLAFARTDYMTAYISLLKAAGFRLY